MRLIVNGIALAGALVFCGPIVPALMQRSFAYHRPAHTRASWGTA